MCCGFRLILPRGCFLASCCDQICLAACFSGWPSQWNCSCSFMSFRVEHSSGKPGEGLLLLPTPHGSISSNAFPRKITLPNLTPSSNLAYSVSIPDQEAAVDNLCAPWFQLNQYWEQGKSLPFIRLDSQVRGTVVLDMGVMPIKYIHSRLHSLSTISPSLTSFFSYFSNSTPESQHDTR